MELMSAPMDDSPLFTDAMRLTPVSSDDAVSVFDGTINQHWTIGPKVHGGAMLALCAKAARLAFARSTAVRQEQLVTEVLDTVDFGVVRLAVGGDVVYENDAIGRLSSSIPGLHAAVPSAILYEEDAETPLAARADAFTGSCTHRLFAFRSSFS